MALNKDLAAIIILYMLIPMKSILIVSISEMVLIHDGYQYSLCVLSLDIRARCISTVNVNALTLVQWP